MKILEVGVKIALDNVIYSCYTNYMKFEDIKVGQTVSDRWFPEWGIGRVTIVLKTRVIISYPNRSEIYDKGHVQFLVKGGY